ncbi:MAG: enoyl-CoA hydratase/isomerase family protein [Pseudomonadota bacterium]
MLDIDRTGGVATLLINRPERKNAFDRALTERLADALETATADTACRVIVIKGAGDIFSAGRDLRAADSDLKDDPFAVDNAWVRVFHALHRSPVPSVAVVRGWAVAGGFTLAMGCDFVLAEREAKFGAFEMKHGFPASVCTPILARLAGPRLGLEFAMFGETIDAERLQASGLINRLAKDAEDLAQIETEFVGNLAALDPLAVKLTRDTFRAAENMPLDNALDMGRQLNQMLAALGRFQAAGSKV